MSHFVGYLFTKDFSVLERYDETREVEPYISMTRDELIRSAWEELEEPENEVDKRNIKTDEDAIAWYTDYMGVKPNADGNIISTYNPESKFDWCRPGGRYKLAVTTKKGATAVATTVGEVDWEESAVPFCYITPEGEWHQIAKMLWWGFSVDQMPEEEWEAQFKAYVATLPRETPLIVIDFHI